MTEAPVPPVYDHVVERPAQRLAGGDENADMPEYRKRAAKLLADVQKPTPVPLAEQIAVVRRTIGNSEIAVKHYPDDMGYRRDVVILRAILATLQQHERAMAERDVAFDQRAQMEAGSFHMLERIAKAETLLRKVRDRASPTGTGLSYRIKWDLWNEIAEALAAMDDAASAAGDAG